VDRRDSSLTLVLGLLCIAQGCAAGAAPPELGPLASGLELGAPSWSHRGTKIAVDSAQPPGVFEIEIATSTVKRLSTEAYHNNPSYSPRDDTLAFVDKERGGLWLRTSRGDVRELVKGRVEMPEHPWSPDGRWIVFTSPRGLSLVAVESGEERVLARAEAGAWNSVVRWGADGAQLIGRLNRTVVIIDARTGDLRRLEDFAGSLPMMGAGGVIWARPAKSDTSLLRRSATGETREIDLGGSIQAIDVDATTGRVLVSVANKGVALIDPESLSVSWVVKGGQPKTLSWAPDGKRFALLRWQGDAAGLYVIDVP
jgi:dipeptidyl aminopeptidase/acylaminoacyl peptidase